jgi:hypothetical protein
MLCSKKEKTTAKLGYIRAKMSQGYRENEHCCTNYFTNEEASPLILDGRNNRWAPMLRTH